MQTITPRKGRKLPSNTSDNLGRLWILILLCVVILVCVAMLNARVRAREVVRG